MDMTDFIPDLERIRRRLMQRPDVDPSAQEQRAAINVLQEAGYRRDNPQVYDDIVWYFAKLMTRKAQKGLFLRGPVGVGKTLGMQIFAAKLGIPVLNPGQIASIFTEVCNRDRMKFEKAITEVLSFHQEVQPLIIDDLGVLDGVRVYGESLDIMVETLAIRYRAFLDYGALTMVTTNLSDGELLERYGRRIDDRFSEMFYFRSPSGKSLRV